MRRPQNPLLIAASILLSASAFGQWSGQSGSQPGYSSVINQRSPGALGARWASDGFNIFARRGGEASVDDSDVVQARNRARDESIARARTRWREQAGGRGDREAAMAPGTIDNAARERQAETR